MTGKMIFTKVGSFRRFFLLVISMSLLLVSRGSANDQEMRMDVFLCPAESVAKREELADGTFKWTTKYASVEEWNGEKFGEVAFDLAPLFVENGVAFPKGSRAVFFPERSVLLVKNTDEMLDLVRALVGGVSLVDEQVLVRTEFSLISCPSLKEEVGEDAISYEQLRRLSGGSWSELARFQIVSKSGERTNSRQGWTGDTSVKPDPSLSTISCQVEFEAVIGPDGNAVDLGIDFQSHGAFANAAKPLKIVYKGSTTVSSTKPQILQMYMSDNQKTLVALVVRSSVVRPSMRPFGTSGP
jgi:hypothetical protein